MKCLQSDPLPAISIRDLTFSYGAEEILSRLNLTAEKGTFLGIIGPNGSGKTTLLKCLVRLLTPTAGRISLAGSDLRALRPAEIARRVGVVPQNTRVDFAFTVEEVVLMGRLPHLRLLQRETENDRRIAREAMESVGIAHLSDRLVTKLSGGELQRVAIAQALAQSPQILLLDEPTAHLDPNHQIEICESIRDLSKTKGLTVVAVFHDLNLAAQYCDFLALLARGRIQALGLPGEVLTEHNLEAVYGVKASIVRSGDTGRPAVLLRPPESAMKEAAGGPRVHVIGGGGAAAGIYRLLRRRGYILTTGVLNLLDSDWQAAREAGLTIVEEAPFSPVGPENHEKNLALLDAADLAVLAAIPVGTGNLKNLAAAAAALQRGKKVIVCDYAPIEERDFTGGVAADIYRGLEPGGAVLAKNDADLVRIAADCLMGK